jgi:Cysteine rich repeat
MARALTLALLLFLSIPSAFAQYVTVIAACTRDVTRLCDHAMPERNLLTECVESHFQDFHERCRSALMQTAAVREACESDIEQQCPGVHPGAGRILLCVKKNFAALGQSCKDAIGHAAELNQRSVVLASTRRHRSAAH